MYIVKLNNNGIETPIHDEKEKLKSGSVVKGINSIDSFSATLLPSNKGFNNIFDFQTLVSVFNTRKNRYEFQGRVLYSNVGMDSDGLIAKEVTCESYFGFLCDSQQTYVEERNWTVRELWQHIIDTHNSQVEGYKHFVLGEISSDLDPNDNIFIGIQRENTWETIKKKLIEKVGGEIRFRVVDGVIYIDHLKQIGETKATKIQLSRNMKSITKEVDPSAYVTRLIPLGCKLKKTVTTTDADGNETTQEVESEERLDITSVNGGKNYIDDETAIKAYGIHVGYMEWDDVTDANNLLSKGEDWLVENNKVQIKYSITALDLSLLGLEIDDFDTHNYHPIINPLLGIDDVARINKKSINVCEETSSTIEVGDNFKTLTDIQHEQANAVSNLSNKVGKIESNYVTNQKLQSERLETNSIISQSVSNILLRVEETYTKNTDIEDFRREIETELSILSDEILMNFTTTTEQINNVDGSLQSKFNKLYKYISFSGENGIVIGSGEKAITLTVDTRGIVFSRNNVAFGFWNGIDFYTGNIIVRLNERAQFGNFAFIPRSDNSLMFSLVSGGTSVTNAILGQAILGKMILGKGD